jgi:hypothetical protein
MPKAGSLCDINRFETGVKRGNDSLLTLIF